MEFDTRCTAKVTSLALEITVECVTSACSEMSCAWTGVPNAVMNTKRVQLKREHFRSEGILTSDTFLGFDLCQK